MVMLLAKDMALFMRLAEEAGQLVTRCDVDSLVMINCQAILSNYGGVTAAVKGRIQKTGW